jgi:hypothetical protein
MTVGALVIQYVNDEVRIGEEVTRQGLIQYVGEKLAEEAGLDPDKYRFKRDYTTIDNYRRILQLHNILGGSGTGAYVKYHNVPKNESIGSLKRMLEKGRTIYRQGQGSIMEALDELDKL